MTAPRPPHSLKKIALAALLLGAVSTPALAAQKNIAADLAPAISQADQMEMESLEKMGLYVKSGDGALSPDLWAGAKRSELVRLLREMPANSPEPAVQKLIRGALLTVNSGGVVNDVPAADGQDLFTLRLKKLLQGGQYDKAAALYGQIEEDAYDPELAHAAITTLFMDSDKSLGCIEARSARQRFPDSRLSADFIAYCDAAVPAAPVVYTIEAFKSLSQEKLAELTADDRIDSSRISKDMLAQIPPQHVLPLLKSKGLSEENRFLINLRALHWGLIDTADLKDYYLTIANQMAADGITATAERWKKLPLGYAALSQSEADGQWPALRTVIADAEIFGTDALMPFADMIHDVKTKDINYSELQAIIPVLIRNDGTLPPYWTEIADELFKADSEKTIDSGLVGAVYLSKPPGMDLEADRDLLLNNLKSWKNKDNYFFNYIIENIDKGNTKDNNGFRVYEKEYRLTFEQDYVMPSQYVWHRLQDISQETNIGETVLLSISALGEKPLRDTNPDVFLTVLKDLELVGLTDASDRLALSAMTGRTFKGEN